MNKAIFTAALVLLLVGCGGAPTAIRFYVIDPVAPEVVGDIDGRSVQILEIKLPQYLERFQIARRQSANQLTFSSNHQWGENLRKNLYRTMTRDISTALGTADVGSSISRTMSQPDYLVRVSLEAFEQNAEGYVEIAGRYQVSNALGEVLASEVFAERAGQSSRGSYDAMVSDLQQLFGGVSLSISQTISHLDAAHDG